MFFDKIELMTGAASLLASAVALLAGACVTYWRDFGARPQQQQEPTHRHITQLPRFANG